MASRARGAIALLSFPQQIGKGIESMRLFLGVILGFFLTVGFAYMYDASTAHPSESTAQATTEQRPMVNWDVVSANWQGWSLHVRNTWNKLATR